MVILAISGHRHESYLHSEAENAGGVPSPRLGVIQVWAKFFTARADVPLSRSIIATSISRLP